MGFKKKKNDKEIEQKTENTSASEEKTEEAATAEVSDSGEEKSLEDKEKTTSDAKEEHAPEDSSEALDDESEENKEQKKKRRKKKEKKPEKKPEDVNIVKELLSLIVYIGIVVLLCYFIINFVGCRSRVDGDSMNATLQDGDNLWVDKLSYTFGKPDRFDIIIFNYDEKTTYVKRIIGLPGETVRIDQKGQIFINEQLLVENYGLEAIHANNLGRANQPVLLGEDEYFVLGDNRNNSSDSRWPDVGNVHKEDIVGKVVLRIYPFKSFGFVK